MSLFLFAGPAQGAERQQLRGHVPEAVKQLSLQPVDRLSGSRRLHLAVGLPLRNREALTTLLQQIYDPASPQYHQYLTPEQFTEMFGPVEKDYQSLIDFFRTNGFTITGLHPNRMLVDVEGAVADVEKALHVTMQVYQHPTEARTFYAPDIEPSVDASVPILHISGLDNYAIPRPALHMRPAAENATPASGSGPSGAYMGSDFRNAYAPNATLNGAGQMVGLVEFDGYYTNDITTYENQAGLPNVPLVNVLLDGLSGVPSTCTNCVAEVSMDIEMVVSMAPYLTQVVVFEGNNWDDILNSMAANNQIKQFSSSWLGASPDPTADQIYQEMIAQRQSFFQASGDADAWCGWNWWPADDPYVTSVGGTMLTMNGSGASYASETVWNLGYDPPEGWDGLSGDYVGSGGGVSTNYSIPVWQQGVNMTAVGGSTTMRNFPDVALTADNVWVIYYNGLSGSAWGTSLAAPLWAGFTALVNQQGAGNGQPSVGFLNPALYTIGTGTTYTACFHDITSGNNTNPCSPTSYFAANGYDLCTGWGTPSGTNLINALVGPPTAAPPGAPSGLTATAAGPITINLGWVNNATNATSILLERSTDNLTFSLIALLGASVTNYSDTSLMPGTTYYYRVQANNSGSNSGYSNTAQATTTSIPGMTWVGDGVSNIWDVGITTNWFNGTSATVFTNQAAVVFNNAGSASPPVTMVGSLQPWSVTVIGSQTYTFTGGGSLTGSMSLTEYGSGQLNLATNNAYSGGTIVNGGTLSLGALTGAGTGSITLNGGTLVLTASGGPAVYANAVNVVATSTLSTPGSASSVRNQALSGAWSGNAVLNVNSSSSLITFSVQGDMTGFGGTIVLTGAGTFRFYNTSTGSSAAGFDLGNGTANMLTRDGGSFNLGALSGGAGTILRGAGSSPNATTYFIGGNNASTTYSGTISNGTAAGAGATTSITKVGAGTLTLTGSNTFTGGTTVSNGTLLVNNTVGSGTGSGAVTVAGGATLGGSGVIAGPVTIGSGGTLAPGANSVGTLTVSNTLVVNGAAVLAYALGTSSDLTVVSGNLTLGGTLNITDAGGFGAGTYKLFTYGGSLTYNGVTIGSTPNSCFTYAVDTNTIGVVNLDVSCGVGAAGTITGPSSVNAGASGVAYSISSVSCATTYTWTVPSGATIASGQGTTSITVNYACSAASGSVAVTPSNGSCIGTSSSESVTVTSVGAAGSITGPTAVCAGQTGANYSIPSVSGATTYTWAVPSGASIASGQGTTSITVNWGATSGNVTVTPANAGGCTGNGSGLSVAVNAVPGTPGTITQGNPTGSSVCTNASGVTYTISSVSGATSYTWSVPAGASITAGQGTTSITVTWGTTGGNVTVTANNSFCSGSAASLAVSLVSSAPVAPTASAGTSVTTSGFTANWGAATGATGYDLDVATDNGFTSFVTGYNNLDVGNVTSYAVTGLNGGTPYYYRVRAYNPCGTSNNSNTQTVTTLARTLTINLVVSNIVHHFTPAQSMPPLPGSVLDQLIYDKTGLTNVNLSSYNSFELRLFAPNGQGISVNRSTNYSSAVSIYYVAGADSSSHTEPATLSFENFSGSMPSNTYSLFYIGNAGNVLNFWGEENYTNAISFTAMKYSFTPAYNPTNTPKTFTSQSDLGYPVSFSYSTSQTNDPGPFVTMAFLLSTNSWIAGNGTWETGTNWSSGAAPSLADSADLITNAGNNTVTIDASTVLSNAIIGCLTISNLSIAGTANSTNTLFLNNAGTTTPLQVLGTVLTLETNGAVVVNNSAVLATESDSMIGKTGGGASLTITNGGAVYDLDGSLGYEAGSSNNTAVVTGVGSVWNNQTYLDVGSSGGSNLLNIAGGSVVATNVVISYGVSASNNVLLVTGGSLVVTNSLGTGLLVVSRVGGKGSLILNNGSVTANALIATNGANSVVTFNGGTLNSGGTFVTNSQVFAVGDSLDAATFHLNGGVHSFAGNLEIRNNATLTGCGTINGNVLVDTGGTVLANCGTLTFSGIVTNNGTMRAIEGSVLEAYGTVVNNGTIDIINGATNFHGGFINSNNGTVLTATSVQISKVSISGQDVVIQIPSVTGHTYQLQYTTSLTPANWTNTGAPQSGTGGALTFTDSDGAAYTQRFYRVDVTAP
jgi:autotransporter-associated beta strand protein